MCAANPDALRAAGWHPAHAGGAALQRPAIPSKPQPSVAVAVWETVKKQSFLTVSAPGMGAVSIIVRSGFG